MKNSDGYVRFLGQRDSSSTKSTAQKMKFFIKNFFSKFDQIRWKLFVQ